MITKLPVYRDRTRAAAVILRGDELLLVSYHFNGETFFALPGGAPKSGESPEQAVRREVEEETGLHLQQLSLLFMSDHIYQSGIGIDTGGPGGLYHELGIYYGCRGFSGTLCVGDEPEHGNTHVIRTAAFTPLASLRSIIFYPSHLIEPILEAAAANFGRPPYSIEDRAMRDYIAPVKSRAIAP